MREFVLDALPGRVIFAPGRGAAAAAAEVRRLGAERVLLVCADRDAELAADVVAELGELVAARFGGVRPHVPGEVAGAARAVAGAARCDLVLSVGGGSTTGTAKAVALATGLPIVAVPTTYAGSEMTPVWGMTEDGVKTTGRDPRVLPRAVVYDVRLTTSLGRAIAAPSALNAMAHCVEALYGPGANPVTDLVAEEGIRALVAGLEGLMGEGADLAACGAPGAPAESGPAARAAAVELAARDALLYGACLAGNAFATAGSGAHHKICHVLGGAYDLPHAELHSVVLPYVARHYDGLPALDRARRALGLPGARGLGARLFDLRARAGVPASLEAIGLPASERDRAAALVVERFAATAPAAAGPPTLGGAAASGHAAAPADPPTPADLRAIVFDAFAGIRPRPPEEAAPA